ncbi:MAG TPA: hypothetical protein ENL46_04095 [Candidatus Aminicenantes bacterium]|nr:hypothetical protein [Candidatus Aminicenantes bacterium]
MMLNEKSLKVLFVSLALVLIMIGAGCTSTSLESNDWTVTTNKKTKTFSIEHSELGPVLKEIEPQVVKNNKKISPADWKVKVEENQLTIITDKSEQTTWEIKAEPNSIKLSCSSDKAVVKGKAPASAERIPARLENQDNDIMYTSLGLISAENIHCLFDRSTDTMVDFSDESLLRRNGQDHSLMDVDINVNKSISIQLIQDYYINVLGLKYYQPKPDRFETAPIAWSSWYCYYMGTTEEDLVKETDTLAQYLKPYGLEYVQLDACYTRGEEANYLEWNKQAFPKGGKWIFDYIKSKGLKPALWVNIYGSNYEKAECEEKYPEDFYLRNDKGELSSACCTADNTVVRLDYTNPDVIERHLKPMFDILKNQWGLKYIKDAGWGTWMDYYEENKEQAFDSSRDSRDVYVEVQKALRETLGPDVYIGGCAMHEVGLGFGVFDGSRIGGDDRAVWYPEKKRGMSMQTYFHSLFGGNYLNNIVWHCDPDAAMVRSPLTLEEGRTIVTAIALTGQLYMASDFMAKLPIKKIELYRKTMPTTPIVPVDLYPYKIESNKREGVVWCCPQVKEFPKAIDLKVNGPTGHYDVVALFNWNDEQDKKKIELDKGFGLNSEKEYIAFDFWNQKPVMITDHLISCDIPAHGTRVFVIKEILDRPQLVATTRHITCAVSVKEMNWDPDSKALSGLSEIIAGSPYSVFIHIPQGMSVSEVDSNSEVMFEKRMDSVLEIRFSGEFDDEQENNLEWTVKFE